MSGSPYGARGNGRRGAARGSGCHTVAEALAGGGDSARDGGVVGGRAGSGEVGR